MDYEIFRWPAQAIFLISMLYESRVTVRVVLKTSTAKLTKFWRRTAVAALAFMSSVNVWAFWEVWNNPALEAAIVTKMLYALAGLMLVIWVSYMPIHRREVFD